jgi:tyrosine-protein kinase Etk/Wzc
MYAVNLRRNRSVRGGMSAQIDSTLAEDEIDLRALVVNLWHQRLAILLVTCVAALASVAYSLYLPDIYKAFAVFLPPKSGQSKMSGMLSQLSTIPFLGGGVIPGGGSEADPLAVLKAHLEKKENLWKVIDKFSLRSHYKIDSEFKVDVEKDYLDSLNIDKDKKSGLVTISFEDESPELAKNVVNFNLGLLSEISKSTVITENRKKKNFLEKRLREAQIELEKIEDQIKLYQEKHQILAMDSQAKATIDAASQLQAEIMVNRVKLKVKLELGIHENHPQVKILRLEIEALEKQVKQVEEGGLVMDSFLNEKDRARGLTYVPLQKIPALKLDMERLLREKVVQQEIYKVLAKENELAKIEASKDQEMIEVIEWAHVPERKSKPRRSIICIVSTLSGFLLACFFVLIKDAWNSPEQVQTSLEAHQES